MRISEISIFDKQGNALYHYKWADPQYLNLSIGVTLGPGSIGLSAKNIACREEAAIPVISKGQLAEMKFSSLSSTVSGDGEIFFGTSPTSQNVPDQKEIIFIIRSNADHNVLPEGVSIPDPPAFRTEVEHVLLKCNENKFAIDQIEMWSATRELVRLRCPQRSASSDPPKLDRNLILRIK
jgi:hypothetical protein